MNFFKYVLMCHLLFDENKTDGGASGPKPSEKQTQPDKDAVIAELTKRLEALEKSKPQTETQHQQTDLDLADKAKQKRETDEKKAAETKLLEKAITFTHSAKQFVKDNAQLLPKSIESIVEQAEKENYGSAIEKESAIKVGIISEFFAIQANMDLLTASQKSVLDDFKKLAKTDREQRAQGVYDQIFEPTFESLKKIRRAELVSKGYHEQTSSENAYKEKLIKGSRKHFLGEK